MRFIRATLTFVVVTALSLGVTVAVHGKAVAAGSVEHIVEITGFKFIPESLSVEVGDTITWINKDIAPHTATADNLSFDTGELKQNESESITVSSDQTLTYFCRFHPTMKATLMFE